VTGWGHIMRADGALPQHADRVIAKPPDIEDLRRAIFDLTRKAAT
jgi:ActR/RegA family two-component response regulator